MSFLPPGVYNIKQNDVYALITTGGDECTPIDFDFNPPPSNQTRWAWTQLPDGIPGMGFVNLATNEWITAPTNDVVACDGATDNSAWELVANGDGTYLVKVPGPSDAIWQLRSVGDAWKFVLTSANNPQVTGGTKFTFVRA